ncbi:MAG: class I SAM-dependent methyltransferase [Clostridiales bacterium]|nr:class I SAM-dependent methyltransferase [Candidatus Apopatousia equi]
MKNLLKRRKLNRKLKTMQKQARDVFIPVLRPKTSKFLKKIVRKNKFDNILEIGTAIGYSGSLMLVNSKNQTARLTTIDIDEERLVKAKENFKNFGVNDRVEILVGDAYEKLLELNDKKIKFDLVLLDGPKGQYFKYYPIIKELLNIDGVLFVDDTLYMGLIDKDGIVKHKHRTIVNSIRNLLNEISNDKNFECKQYKIEDGFVIAKKIKEN